MVLTSFYNMEKERLEVLVENYRDIFHLLSQINFSKEKLEFVKSKFKDDINSPRRYENINDMKDLLRILEIRSVIGYDNIGKLYDIVEIADDASKRKIGKYLNNQAFWLSKNLPEPVELAFYEDKQMSPNTPEFSLPIEVIRYISENIKRYWKDFARELKIIQEKEIDLIEKCNGNKTEKCLEIFVREARSQGLSNPYGTLLIALERIRRRDVKEHVEGLLQSSSKRS